MRRVGILTLTLLTAAAAAYDPNRLLRPKALGPKLAPETILAMRKNFADPPAEYRTMPLWSWNDDLQWPRLKEQLAQFKQQGMGGVFIHPRPGLLTEYLGEEWMRLTRLSVEESKRLGLLLNIYDEYSWPSGAAGGRVAAAAPDTAAQFVEVVEEGDVAINGLQSDSNVVAIFAIQPGSNGAPQSVKRLLSGDQLTPGERLLQFRLQRVAGNPAMGGLPWVDLTNPATAPLFIQITYEAYKKQIGAEFGRTVKWFMTDEADLGARDSRRQVAPTLPLSYYILAEFHKRRGYDLAGELPSLFWDVGEYRRVRFDYWQTLHDLWMENFWGPLFDWCDRNNIQFTGHVMEHTWPNPLISPANGSVFAHEHVPGIDMLYGAGIRTRGVDPHMLFTIKEMVSVVNQMGRRRAFCETFGGSGWDATMEHLKRFGDWVMVHGINFIDQHVSHTSIRGGRKRDWGPSFSDASTWWPYYKLQNDHMARVCYMLSRGTSRNRILVLEPTTSGFLWARRSDMGPGGSAELVNLGQTYDNLVQSLADHQMDFDLGDEYMLGWYGKGTGGRLAIGAATYDLVVWPENMINIRHETIAPLERYLSSGGHILALCPPAPFVDGRPDQRLKAMAVRYASQWHSVAAGELIAEIERRLARRVTFDSAVPPGVGFAERFLESGERVLFFANTNLRGVAVRATVEGGGLEEWDTVIGRISQVLFQPAGSARLTFELDLPPAGSHLFLVRKAGSPGRRMPEVRFSRIEPQSWRVIPTSPNLLVVDYCDLKVAAAEYPDVNTWRADRLLWQAHGFDRPVSGGNGSPETVQFKKRFWDINHFDPSSGFEAIFRFAVADAAAIRDLQVAIETPELYQVTLNGTKLKFEGAAPWLDSHIRALGVAKWAKLGENLVRISGRPFDIRMDLEAIYIRGNFTLVPGNRGFELAAPGKLSFGSWAKQGYPFYSDSVTYEAQLTFPPGSERLRVELGEWQGSVVEIRLDGEESRTLGWQPYTAELPVTAGRHLLTVRVVPTSRNIFGPFHTGGKVRMKGTPLSWASFPQHQPTGSNYDMLDYGLMGPPALSVLTRPIREDQTK